MQKTGISTNRKPVVKTGNIIPTGSKPTGLSSCWLCRRFHLHRQMTKTIWLAETVIPANSKSTGLTPNPARGISFAPANGKLCFEYLKTFSVPENHLPPVASCKGEKRAPKSAFFDESFEEDRSVVTTEKAVAGFYSKAGGLLYKRRRAFKKGWRAFEKRSVSVLKKPAGFCSSLNFKLL